MRNRIENMPFSKVKGFIHKLDEKHKARSNEKSSDSASSSNHDNKGSFGRQYGSDIEAINGGEDIFVNPISSEQPPDLYKKIEHAQKPQGCSSRDYSEAIQTNNFYNNLALEDQTSPIWTLPYSLWLAKEPDTNVGIAVNHTSKEQRVYGPEANVDPVQFYFNPPRIKSFVFSAKEVSEDNIQLRLSDHKKLSVLSKLVIDGNYDKNIEMPLVHGMGFITAVYNNVVPVIGSQVGIQEFRRLGDVGNVQKYRALLFNQVVWSIYVTNSGLLLQLQDPGHILANGVANGMVVQLCKGESVKYDDTCGIYANNCSLSGTVSDNGDTGQYSFKYDMQGSSRSGSGLFWCLPHHYEVLIDDIAKRGTGLELDSPTKGVMRSYVTNELTMQERGLPVGISWEPWSCLDIFRGESYYSDKAKDVIRKVASSEVADDVVGMANIDSMYTSGKILDKYAYLAYVCHFVLNDDKLTSIVLPKIKEAIEIFANNRQKFPLVYDKTWKGLVSSAEPAADFGNSNYNDHHFHYGYHVHAIALVAKVDQDVSGNWLNDNNGLVAKYASTILRDYANPTEEDKYFPQFRTFDWYHGHSFAHGIFPSGDGKDEESSSEDYHSIYGMKLYAKIIRDRNMENRANLILAIMKRSMNMYMLLSDDNTIQPKNFIKNKVAGITFENKLDYATYFGRGQIGDEWIHGIHMRPITPVSSYMRGPSFVREEWDRKLAPVVKDITDGWKGVLMLNYALLDPKTAWSWFSRDNWDNAQIDNGMSRTWSLAYIAGILGKELD